MSIVKDVVGGITGSTAADAATDAAGVQAQASREALAELIKGKEEGQQFLAPFEVLGQQGLAQTDILTDPQAQFNFLQQNPLFDLALQNANQQTQQAAASQGRLSAGDTLQQLSNNVLLSAQPLIGQQQQNVSNLLGLGQNLATTQANTALGVGSQAGNILTDIGNVQAAGKVSSANAKQQGLENIISLGSLALSDRRLKKNIREKGSKNGHSWYSWEWNDLAGKLFGLFGKSDGVIAQEVMHTGNVKMINGYLCVDYKALGV